MTVNEMALQLLPALGWQQGAQQVSLPLHPLCDAKKQKIKGNSPSGQFSNGLWQLLDSFYHYLLDAFQMGVSPVPPTPLQGLVLGQQH